MLGVCSLQMHGAMDKSGAVVFGHHVPQGLSPAGGQRATSPVLHSNHSVPIMRIRNRKIPRQKVSDSGDLDVGGAGQAAESLLRAEIFASRSPLPTKAMRPALLAAGRGQPE